MVVDSLKNPEKQFSDIVSDVLASQSEPSDLLTSPSEMNFAVVDVEGDGEQRTVDKLGRTSSVRPINNELYHPQQQQPLQDFQHLHQQQQQQPHWRGSQTTSSPTVYKSTHLPFKPTGSTLNSELGQNIPGSWVGQSDPFLDEERQPPPSGGSRPGPWSLNPKPTNTVFAEISATPFLEDHLDREPGFGNSDPVSNLPQPNFQKVKNSFYAEVSSTSKTTQVGVAPRPTSFLSTSTLSTTTFKPKPQKGIAVFLKPTQMTEFMMPEDLNSVISSVSDIPGYLQYDPSSVTQVPEVDAEQQQPSIVTPITYKPTFKPYVPDANDTKFVVDFVLEEVSTEEEEAAPVAAVDADVVSVAENDTMLALATMISEKLNFVEMGESATKYINQLSNNSLVNLVVIFGLPIITAVLSVMGAGPLAIATTAWVVPIAAVLVLPDLVQK